MIGPTILVLEASTYRASVALVRDGHDVVTADVAMKGEREERLMPAVATILEDAHLTAHHLSGVVCGAGPGSFTSLRIAGAIAKGLCTGANIPMFAVSSLALMVGSLPVLASGWYLAALDALRGEHYTALIRTDDQGVVETRPMELHDSTRLHDLAESSNARLVLAVSGSSSTPTPGMIYPVARGIVRCQRVIQPVDLDTWEPDYGRLPAAESKRVGV